MEALLRSASPPYLWELRPYLRQVAGELLLGSLAGIVMNTAIVLPALALGAAIDAILALERGEGDPRAAATAALWVLGATALVEGTRVMKRWWLMTANARIRANLRADALRGVLAWPPERLHATPVGDLLARIDGDVDTLGVGVREATTEIWDTLLFSTSMIVGMLLFDARLAALALVPVPAAMLLALVAGRWVRERISRARAAAAVATAALQELLAGVRVLRLFGHEATAVRRYAVLSEAQAQANLDAAGLAAKLQPTYTVMMVAGVIVLLWQGGEHVVAGLLTAGELVAFLELFLRFAARGFRVPQLINSVQSGGAAYRRLRPLLAPPLSVAGEPPWASFKVGYVAGSRRAADRPNRAVQNRAAQMGAAARRGPASITLAGVDLRYPGAARLALRDVSLAIPSGALVAVTGAVASGKSALAKALVGLYAPERGAVLLDGVSLDTLAPAERAARIGYLPQDPWLFSGTVRENVVFGAPGLDSANAEPLIERAVRLAALEADLRAFPAGLDTLIGEGGVRVSGGQRQRIALARALLAGAPGRPGLLVLDDPFSAVDVDTEVRLVEGLLAAVGPGAPPDERATIVLCSHRLAAFPRADLVVLLDDGHAAEVGTHAELMVAGGRYARIYRAQQRAGQLGRAGAASER